jgi:quercetin dioxygenase-like cupin family protein
MKREEIILQTNNVKVRIIELHTGESGPFHLHTKITDNMFGISGEIILSMKNPPENIILKPGVHCRIEPGRVHCVTNNLKDETSKYLLIQGVGTYDFIEENA